MQTLEQIRDFKGKYPRQLWWLFLAEMWERFSFYGMRGMLTIFMVEKLRMNESEANLKYGATQAFVYTMAFVGGFFADKVLGFRKSIFWGGLLMILGSFTLAAAPEKTFLHRHQHHRRWHGLLQTQHLDNGWLSLPRRRSASRRRLLALLLGHQHWRSARRFSVH